MRTRPILLLAALAAAATLSSAACSGGGGGGDDDDSPTPSPTFLADRCQIVWENDLTATVKDVYILDAPAGSWTLGTAKQYAVTATGFEGTFYGALDLVSSTWEQQAVTTTGVFALVLGGTQAGQVVNFDDLDPQNLWSVDSGGNPVSVIGTGGEGSFSGFWSDPYSQNVTPGSGTITLVLDGTAHTLGVDLSYALCYTDDQAFPSPLPRRPR